MAVLICGHHKTSYIKIKADNIRQDRKQMHLPAPIQWARKTN